MDLRTSLIAQQYAANRSAMLPSDTAPTQNGAREFAQEFAATLQRSENLSMQAMVGEADPHALVQALAQTELAIETVVTVRDRVVEAYQEILRMPV